MPSRSSGADHGRRHCHFIAVAEQLSELAAERQLERHTTLEELHRGRELVLFGSYNKMKVIGHDDDCVETDVVFLQRRSEHARDEKRGASRESLEELIVHAF